MDLNKILANHIERVRQDSRDAAASLVAETRKILGDGYCSPLDAAIIFGDGQPTTAPQPNTQQPQHNTQPQQAQAEQPPQQSQTNKAETVDDEWRIHAEKVLEEVFGSGSGNGCGEIPNRREMPLTALSDFPPFVREEENKSILIKGAWLERGGSAWWISTAGTGKSIASIQLAMLWSEGLPFAGLAPNGGRKLSVWIIQSEDSKSRITRDREDIIMELSERHPETDWRETARRVKFVNIGPFVGSDFIERLSDILERAIEDPNETIPDIVIINPFMAYIGGPISDGNFVTPFLRGGEINRKPTIGLQAMLEKYDIAALIFHHTAKPPSGKELSDWLKSPMPEYQGAGSSDITNWGRSFITMMKVEGTEGKIMLTAGKNGHELGWERFGGVTRRFMSHSDGRGITGGSRHAWRDCTAEETAYLAARIASSEQQRAAPGRPQKSDLDPLAAARSVAENYREDATGKTREAFADHFWRAEGQAHSKRIWGEVFDILAANPSEYGFGKTAITAANRTRQSVLV